MCGGAQVDSSPLQLDGVRSCSPSPGERDRLTGIAGRAAAAAAWRYQERCGHHPPTLEAPRLYVRDASLCSFSVLVFRVWPLVGPVVLFAGRRWKLLSLLCAGVEGDGSELRSRGRSIHGAEATHDASEGVMMHTHKRGKAGSRASYCSGGASLMCFSPTSREREHVFAGGGVSRFMSANRSIAPWLG